MSLCVTSLLNRLSLFVGIVIALCAIPSLQAQVLVDLSIKRTLYIAYEPLLATVRITNLSGNRLLLADVEGKKWFGFHIETLEGTPIPPTDPDYEIPPIQVESGESITRTVNLTQLYPISDFGSYRVSATVYASELSGYFSSPPLIVEVTEGRILWEQTVGTPEKEGVGSSSRTISLLSHRLTQHTDLYLRISDKDAGIVYCTHCLGDFIAYGKPDIMLDAENTVHVLQNTSPREFVYSKVDLNGKILQRNSIQSTKDRPQLRRAADGSVSVLGGIAYDPNAPLPSSITPKLSERPPALPMASATPQTKAKAKLTESHPKQTPKPTPPKKAKKSPSPSPSPSPIAAH